VERGILLACPSRLLTSHSNSVLAAFVQQHRHTQNKQQPVTPCYSRVICHVQIDYHKAMSDRGLMNMSSGGIDDTPSGEDIMNGLEADTDEICDTVRKNREEDNQRLSPISLKRSIAGYYDIDEEQPPSQEVNREDLCSDMNDTEDEASTADTDIKTETYGRGQGPRQSHSQVSTRHRGKRHVGKTHRKTQTKPSTKPKIEGQRRRQGQGQGQGLHDYKETE
jgi:hypothetical protein